MSISRENYEIWFTDWLDNSLDPSQLGELEDFLRANPDLREEFMILSDFSLKPGSAPFPFKDRLKRSPADLSDEQFDILCTASLEKDLLPDQEAELRELISSDVRKKEAFELIGRMKLVPPDVVFPYKRRLLKKTAGAVILRLVAVSLSAAAIIAVVLFTAVFRQDKQGLFTNPGVAVNIPGTSVTQPGIIAEAGRENSPAREADKESGPSREAEIVHGQSNEEPVAEKEPVAAEPGRIAVEIEKIAFNSLPAVAEAPGNSLVGTGAAFSSPAEDDDRSRIGKFIAQTFREKILKDENPQDSPIKGYEIAEAGIEGLNRLFGWEMALSRNNDDEGNVRSVNFSSRVVKFQAPVKNNELAE